MWPVSPTMPSVFFRDPPQHLWTALFPDARRHLAATFEVLPCQAMISECKLCPTERELENGEFLNDGDARLRGSGPDRPGVLRPMPYNPITKELRVRATH